LDALYIGASPRTNVRQRTNHGHRGGLGQVRRRHLPGCQLSAIGHQLPAASYGEGLQLIADG
jgi:hypothetical protein